MPCHRVEGRDQDVQKGEEVPREEVKDNYFTEPSSGSEAGSYLRLVDSCITQLKAQGPSRTCSESKEAEEKSRALLVG